MMTAESSNLAASVTLRSVLPEDEAFLFKLYASTRSVEMAAWGWNQSQQETFLNMQFRAQQHSYNSVQADSRIILLNDQPAGRIIIIRTDEEIRLADIALLPEYRGKGIGTFLIEQIFDEANREIKPVRLHVLTSNHDAFRLYERLGFIVTDNDGINFQMERSPVLSEGAAINQKAKETDDD